MRAQHQYGRVRIPAFHAADQVAEVVDPGRKARFLEPRFDEQDRLPVLLRQREPAYAGLAQFADLRQTLQSVLQAGLVDRQLHESALLPSLCGHYRPGQPAGESRISLQSALARPAA